MDGYLTILTVTLKVVWIMMLPLGIFLYVIRHVAKALIGSIMSTLSGNHICKLSYCISPDELKWLCERNDCAKFWNVRPEGGKVCIFRTINGRMNIGVLRYETRVGIQLILFLRLYVHATTFYAGKKEWRERIRKIQHTFGIVSKLSGGEERKVQKRDKFCTSG